MIRVLQALQALRVLRVVRVIRATPEDRRDRRDPKGIPELQAGRQDHRVYRGQPVLRRVLDPAV